MPDPFRLVATTSFDVFHRSLARMSPGSRNHFARMLMQDRFDPQVRLLAGFFEQALHAWRNRQYDVALNGEATLLRLLAPFAPKVAFDVGANVGEWSLAALAQVPGVQVHAFEIMPQTAEIFERALAAQAARVVLNRVGLADAAGEIALYLSPNTDTANSTLRGAIEIGMGGLADKARPIETVPVRVITGDAYVAERGIDYIDLLKIDVEGGEPKVLAGFEQSFARGAIGLVQFEYGQLCLLNRFLLSDAYRFFEARGFVLGKLLPEGVAFKPFEIDDEDFIGPNYVACHGSRGDLIEALRCAPLTVT